MSDEEYHRQLKKFVQDVRSALSIKKSFERLVQIGRRTGLSDIQIGDDIRAEFKGELPDVTIRKYLPPSFKHQEKSNTRYSDAIRVSHIQPPQPKILSHDQVTEIVRQRQDAEPPKPIDITIGINQAEHESKTIEVVFDPAPIDRDRTQVFIIEIDLVTKKVKKYKTVGRRTVR